MHTILLFNRDRICSHCHQCFIRQ